MMRPLVACAVALLAGLPVFSCTSRDGEDCAVGAERCACTAGGGCDPGLQCLSNLCVAGVASSSGGASSAGNASSTPASSNPQSSSRAPSSSAAVVVSSSAASASAGATSASGAAGSGSSAAGSSSSAVGSSLSAGASSAAGLSSSAGGSSSTSGTSSGGGASSLGGSSSGVSCPGGCTALDVVFALDASMTSELSNLTTGDFMTDFQQALAVANCGNTSYRIGVVDNASPVFRSGGAAGPWWDHANMDLPSINTAFQAAVGELGMPELGCAHPLSNVVELLTGDTTGFVRAHAQLVVVVVARGDDYGAYDNVAGNSCGLGCSTVGSSVEDLHNALVALKGGNQTALAALVWAGDPAVQGGVDLCGRPGGCCNGVDCTSNHATRLAGFVSLLAFGHGELLDACQGAVAIQTGLSQAAGSTLQQACAGFVRP